MKSIYVINIKKKSNNNTMMMWWYRYGYLRHVTLLGKLLEGGQDCLEGNFELIQMHNSYARGRTPAGTGAVL